MRTRFQLLDYIPGETVVASVPIAPAFDRRKVRPLCEREGCSNEVASAANRFCSYTCRNDALKEVYREVNQRSAARRTEAAGSQSTPELKQAFKLAYAKVPAAEWPERVRDAYNEHLRAKRKAGRAENKAS